MQIPKKIRSMCSVWFLTVVFFGTLLCAEALLRVFPLYESALLKTTYWFTADTPVHRVDWNTEVVYWLQAGASMETDVEVHPAEKKYRRRKVSINSLGFRGREHEAQKPDGVFRIIVMGGSNTYGAAVSDEDAYPAVMERILNASGGKRRFEVWNSGVCASVLSQRSEVAMGFVDNYDPDLIVMQMHNTGRRAFLPGQDVLAFLLLDSKLMVENIPFLPSLKWSASPAHEFLLRHCVLYRALNAWINCLALGGRGTPEMNFIDYPEEEPLRQLFLERVTALGDLHSRFMFENFSNIFSLTPIVFFDPLGTFAQADYYAGIECIRLDASGKPAEYSDLHPPSHVYEWYAEVLVRELRERGLIPE